MSLQPPRHTFLVYTCLFSFSVAQTFVEREGTHELAIFGHTSTLSMDQVLKMKKDADEEALSKAKRRVDFCQRDPDTLFAEEVCEVSYETNSLFSDFDFHGSLKISCFLHAIGVNFSGNFKADKTGLNGNIFRVEFRADAWNNCRVPAIILNFLHIYISIICWLLRIFVLLLLFLSIEKNLFTAKNETISSRHQSIYVTYQVGIVISCSNGISFTVSHKSSGQCWWQAP